MLNQPCTHWQQIIADDGSRDDTAEITSTFKDDFFADVSPAIRTGLFALLPTQLGVGASAAAQPLEQETMALLAMC